MDQPTRSVKISDDERLGWSSDRPRRPGEPERPPRPADVSVKSRVLPPTDRLRYSPGSLCCIVCADQPTAESFAARVVEERGALLSLPKVVELIRGRVPDEALEEKARELRDAAVAKRLNNGESVVVVVEGLEPEEREKYVRMAAPLRRPRHLLFLDVGKDQVAEEDRDTINALRTAVNGAQMGQEGFATSMRLGGPAIRELKKMVFAAPPKDD